MARRTKTGVKARRTPQQQPKKAKPFKTAGGIAGSKVGGIFGHAALGERLGKWFGSGLGQLLGSGDYHSNFSELATNSIIMPRICDVPTVNADSRGRGVHEVRMRKREYLMDIVSSSVQGSFRADTFSINPGNGITFPWLATIAQSFEQYRLNGMIFEFKTMSGEYIGAAGTGSALGSIIMATQYDVSDGPFENKFVMENYDMAQSSKPSLSAIHGVECERSESVLSELYVSSPSGLPAGADPKFFDFGRFTIASVGTPVASTNLGELWVSYDVSLFKPKLQPGRTVPEVATTFSHHHARTTVASTAMNFGTVSLVTSGNIVSTCTSTVLSYTGLNPGSQYLLTISFLEATGVDIATDPFFPITVGTGVNLLTSAGGVIDTNNNLRAPNNSSGAASSTSYMTLIFVRPDVSGAVTVSTSSGTYVGVTSTNVDIFMTLLDSSVSK